jgi:hypothetical protein
MKRKLIGFVQGCKNHFLDAKLLWNTGKIRPFSLINPYHPLIFLNRNPVSEKNSAVISKEQNVAASSEKEKEKKDTAGNNCIRIPARERTFTTIPMLKRSDTRREPRPNHRCFFVPLMVLN